jgi:hypothetical protein
MTDARPGAALKAALFTTYDRADETFVVEHVLPLLLKLSREPDGEGAERQYFLLDLDRRLQQLHDRLVIVSSSTREERPDPDQEDGAAYRWIWRSIRHLTVGRKGRAVQHAKLWLLHWGTPKAGSPEQLEIVVSSANLTRSAFRGQLQGAWRACIDLLPKKTGSRLAGWGVLPEFLRELASSAGADDRAAYFTDLLSRAPCPENVVFVASVPGKHSRQTLRRTPWGGAGLAKIAPPGKGAVAVSILAPYVGSWSEEGLRLWCDRFEGVPERLELVWIDKHHPWKRTWVLPKSTLQSLIASRASLLWLPHDPDDRSRPGPFHNEHHTADHRWSHAKVYSFRRGRARRLLITSANFSPAAWGREMDGSLEIENFELGVCIEQADWPFKLDPFEDEKDIATVLQSPDRDSGLITWAHALWDGRTIVVECRCREGRRLNGGFRVGSRRLPVANWETVGDPSLRMAKFSWTGTWEAPFVIDLTCEGETVLVPIFDARQRDQRESTRPPEVDDDLAQIMLDQLVLEQYGGRVAVEEPKPGGDEEENNGAGEDPGDGLNPPEEATGSDSYALPAFVLARRHLGVVDNWSRALKQVPQGDAGTFERGLLHRDGELLMGAFRRQAKREESKGGSAAMGATLAGAEIALRLKHFPEA